MSGLNLVNQGFYHHMEINMHDYDGWLDYYDGGWLSPPSQDQISDAFWRDTYDFIASFLTTEED